MPCWEFLVGLGIRVPKLRGKDETACEGCLDDEVVNPVASALTISLDTARIDLHRTQSQYAGHIACRSDFLYLHGILVRTTWQFILQNARVVGGLDKAIWKRRESCLGYYLLRSERNQSETP